MPTDEEVNKRQVAIAKLRDEAEAARLDAEAAQREHDNAITMAQLDAEEARLKAQIEQDKETADAGRLKAAAAAQVAQVTGEVDETKYPKGAVLQTQADGTVIVLSIPGGEEAPLAPVAVTSDTPLDPTPPVVEPVKSKSRAAAE